MPALVPPQMIEIEAVGAMAILLEKRSMMPYSAASRHGPRSCARAMEAASASRLICWNMRLFQTFAITLSIGTPIACRK